MDKEFLSFKLEGGKIYISHQLNDDEKINYITNKNNIGNNAAEIINIICTDELMDILRSITNFGQCDIK